MFLAAMKSHYIVEDVNFQLRFEYIERNVINVLRLEKKLQVVPMGGS